MEYLSVIDMFKIGVGPSSSHTLGPWKAALEWSGEIDQSENIVTIQIHLFGSLSLTGRGHATDVAIMMGLSGLNPAQVTSVDVEKTLNSIRVNKNIILTNGQNIPFIEETDVIFEKEFLDFHPNGMTFVKIYQDGRKDYETYYSIGGGFICHGEEIPEESTQVYPYPFQKGKDIIAASLLSGLSMPELILANEAIDRPKEETIAYLLEIWDVMRDCMYAGCHTQGYLPGGLQVKRRAHSIFSKLYFGPEYHNSVEWMEGLKSVVVDFQSVFKWVSAFAIAINEENAAMGRVVTAPTNGSAGVIPAVLMYYLAFSNPSAGENEIVDFLCVASEIGCIFKKGATISAAMGGCQAEIGVSSAMAAAGLTHVKGGSVEQCIIAAEVAMEHHLGLTCDPIDGLVQIPCIERNSMGAIKAITACHIALDRDPADIKVSLDKVVKTMWATAQDMNRKYKETSEGGLATAMNEVEC